MAHTRCRRHISDVEWMGLVALGEQQDALRVSEAIVPVAIDRWVGN